MRARALLLGLLLAALIAPGGVAADEKDAIVPPKVFRTVLDERPRIVVVHLDDAMWLAYDATNGSLYKAWAGTVKMDGAVHTTIHGPQPTSSGAAYVLQEDGPAWLLQLGKDRLVDAQVKWLGYGVHKGRVSLFYDVMDGPHSVRVTETPGFEADGNGGVRLIRRVETQGVPKGVKICMRIKAQALSPDEPITSDTGLRMLPVSLLKLDEGTMHGVDAHAVLRSNATTTITMPWRRSLVDALHKHKRAKAPPPGPSDADTPPPPPAPHPSDVPVGSGVSVRVYEIGQSMSRIPELIPGQTPNVSHILPRLDLHLARGDFGKVEDHFVTHVDGFIQVDKAGKYTFRLISDDGSRLYIADKLVVDHDGLHGPTEMDGDVELATGRHKLFAEHFENGGGEQLTMLWRPPGAKDFTLVPNENLWAPKGEVRVTSPGKKKIRETKRRGVPGDGEPLVRVHPSFDLTGVRPDGFEPRVGGMDWLPDGRLIICCWESEGGVYVLDNVHKGATAKPTVKKIAEGLAEPLGLRVVDGRIFVLQKQELTELIDHDGDEVIDQYRCVAAGWGVTPNFHEFAFGLVHKDGHFYAALATAIMPGGASSKNQHPDRGRVIKIAPDGSYTFTAHGLRTPNGIGLGVDDEIFVTDNQGDWLPVSKVVHVPKTGAFFGNRSVDPVATKHLVEQPPLVWLPQGEIGNSPGEPGILREGPYAGQMCHCDITHGGLKRVFVEKVGGQYQGCVFRFIQGLEAGTNRWTRGPDGSLYVGGIGSTGNWGQSGKKRFGLERLDYTSRSTFDLLEIRAGSHGFQLHFTEPLADVAGNHRDDYHLTRWHYVPTAQYGGPKKDVRAMKVGSVWVSPDRKIVNLQLAETLDAGQVVHLRLAPSVRNSKGERPWSVEGWYTLNKTPNKTFLAMQPQRNPNTLTEAERAQGWKLLFDGKTTKGWRGFKKEGVPSKWTVSNGTLTFDPKASGDGGDVVTEGTFGDFELSLEWRVAKNGNSGICYRFNEDRGAMWATGVEMQVLDNAGHYDGEAALTSAGSVYGLVAPRFDASRGPDRWNEARIVADGDKVAHYLNGWKIAEYDRASEDWAQRIQKSKFAKMDGFAVPTSGHIGLQDHGDRVSYRSIKIRPLR